MANILKDRFHALAAEKLAVEAKIQPVQDRYNALRKQQNDLDVMLKPIAGELKSARAPLYEIDNERAAIARALNGQTGKA